MILPFHPLDYLTYYPGTRWRVSYMHAYDNAIVISLYMVYSVVALLHHVISQLVGL